MAKVSERNGICDLTIQDLTEVLMAEPFCLQIKEAFALANVDMELTPALGYVIRTKEDYKEYCQDMFEGGN